MRWLGAKAEVTWTVAFEDTKYRARRQRMGKRKKGKKAGSREEVPPALEQSGLPE